MFRKTAGAARLTDVERRLVDHVRRGELLDLAGAEPVDEAAMRAWDSTRTVRAVVLRDILRGRLAPNPDPHGLRLRGARIAGRLDLENLTTSIAVELLDCLLGEGLIARGATLPALVLSGCRLEHPSQPPLDGDQLTAAGLALDQAVITADCETGAVRLAGAHLGRLKCDGAAMRNDAGPALNAAGLKANEGVYLSGGFQAIGTGETGAVRLAGAHLGSQLDCTDARMHNDSGPALMADGLQVDQRVFLSGRFQAVGAGETGAVWLPNAHLGQLECDGATICNNAGPALLADNLQVDQNVFLRGEFQATGTSKLGAVRLPGAHLHGQLDCTHARMHNDSGPALMADGLQVDQNVFLRGRFQAVGAVWLPDAHLGQLECDGATICNNAGPALLADNLQVDQNVYLRGEFEAIGTSKLGAVRLRGAHLGGDLECTDARMRNNAGPALDANNLQVDQNVFLSDGFEAVGTGDDVALNLSQMLIGGELKFAPERLEHTADPQARLALDGLTYTGLPAGISLDCWLHLLCKATPSYAAQPYQQLAAAWRAAGHDGKVRRILMAQRQAQIDRGVLTSRERAWARLTRLTLGYGYQPWRALLFLIAVAITAVILALTLGAQGGLARTDPQPPTATQCSVVERVAVGLDLGLPLVKTGTPAQCEPTTSPSGQVLTVAGWGLQLLAWAFATLFVAGFTGAVRKT
jgi:hypothetical protein